ncbi:MAG: hypothetical protein JW889_08785 [Verrucomicrobia bacterium]|nr:hypothetical protein [Verrucomicrobiota bacterium]
MTGEVPYAPPFDKEQRAAIAERLDMQRTLRHIERLSSYHRPAPSPGLDRAMRYIERELRAAGLTDVETITYQCDGKTAWWVGPTPPAWTCDRATLSIEAPDRMAIADWETAPARVTTFSTSCNVTADVVEVTDWDSGQLNLKGKIVLTSAAPLVAHDKAVQAGAVGVLLAPPADPKDDKLRGAVGASSLSDDPKDWASNRFAFNISFLEAETIRTALADGKRVRVKAVIEGARTAPATAPIVTAWIRPSKPTTRTVLLLAEVAGPKPGANGVSGAAALLSLARNYVELLDDGSLLAPERNIQVLFVPDLVGARAYVEKRRAQVGNVLAVIHLGIIGTNTETGPFKDRPLSIADGGWLLPSCVPYLALDIGRYCATANLVDVAGRNAPLLLRMHARGPVNAQTVFYGGDLGIQTVSISYLPDSATNTSIDTLNELDATALRRASYIALGTAYALATPAQQELQRFGSLIGAYSMHDLSGSLIVFGMLLVQPPKGEIVDLYTYIDAVVTQNQTRNRTTTSDALKILVEPKEENAVRRFGSTAEAAYRQRVEQDVKLYEARPAQLSGEASKALSEKRVALLGEIPTMRWRGPVTPELLERHAPMVLPIPEAVDITALFALINSERALYNVWAEHEAMKWIGIPFPLPPSDKVELPPRADLDETIAFLRRCEKAGVIAIRPRQEPSTRSASGGSS